MISVIICSVSPSFLEQVQNNIRNTIGIDHEIIFHNNTIHPKGICEVYNLLAENAKYPYLCFVHEDVLFTTQNWGQVVESIFKDPEAGVIGVAGSKYKSKYYSGWYTGVKEFDCANIIHEHRDTNEREHLYLNPSPVDNIQQTVCVDGVFICARKNIWQQIQFDEKELRGFHFYDIDFSLRATHICKVLVTYEIEMVHITHGGDFGDKWVEPAMLWHQYFAKKLPVGLLPAKGKHEDHRIIKTWLDWLKNQNISFSNKMKWIQLQKLYLQPQLFYSIMKFLFYKPLRLKYIHFNGKPGK